MDNTEHVITQAYWFISDYMEAINITAIAGDKGKHAYSCEVSCNGVVWWLYHPCVSTQDNTDGSNVISVTFQPQQSTLVSDYTYTVLIMC